MARTANAGKPARVNANQPLRLVLEDNLASLRVLDILEHIDREQHQRMKRESDNSMGTANAPDDGEAA